MANEEKNIDPADGLEILDDIFGTCREDKKLFHRLSIKLSRAGRIFHDAIFEIKEVLQRVFRKNHLSNSDTWNLSHELAPQILKRLIAFRKLEKSGHPIYFSEWEDDGAGYCRGMTRAEYDKAKSDGEFGGGESKAWNEVIDKMIFAFEYNVVNEGCIDKDEEEFFKKWNIKDPHRETLDNLSWGYSYITNDGMHMNCGQKNYEEICLNKDGKYDGYKFIGKHKTYYDKDAYEVIRNMVDEGMTLFGKFYWNLWD